MVVEREKVNRIYVKLTPSDATRTNSQMSVSKQATQSPGSQINGTSELGVYRVEEEGMRQGVSDVADSRSASVSAERSKWKSRLFT